MAVLDHSSRLKKELKLFDVYALATGATLSAGLFLLPGLAAKEAGPAMVLCYLIAAVPLIPAMLSIVELATAMPRAGGAYYFLDRALGPLAGTVGGMGTWLALVLKSAFALVGMGAYLSLFLPETQPWLLKAIACAFAVLFGIVNWLGSKRSGRFQIYLVVGLLAILVLFIGRGVINIRLDGFDGFFDAGTRSILSTAGLVYISYVGVTKVASVSEEVQNPERNLPLGVFLALFTAIAVYLLCTSILVGVIDMEVLTGRDGSDDYLTPMAHAAELVVGQWGVVLLSIAALLAFTSVANAGILSSSRYPLAMARDHLLPRQFRRLNKRTTPGFAILITVAAILFFLIVLDPVKIAKLASAFQLLMFAMLCLAVIVMRESRIESYDPGYKSPWYPWMQIVGIVSPFVLISEMGWLAVLFTSSVVAVGVGWYFYYARRRVTRHGAVYQVFERLGRTRSDDLDRELRGILKEKGLREHDPFVEILARSTIIDIDDGATFEQIVHHAAEALSARTRLPARALVEGFMEGTRTGATPVAGGVALPHLRLSGIDIPFLVLARSRSGVVISTGDAFGETKTSDANYALFFLLSPEADPGQHLRLLAELASRVDQDGFLDEWRAADHNEQLRAILLRHERYLPLMLKRGTASEAYIDRAIVDLDLPDTCLVAIIHRAGESFVPRGRTVLLEGDRLSIIGDEKTIRDLYQRFPDDSRA